MSRKKTREGYVFKKCVHCGRKVPASNRCNGCGSRSYSWAFRVDTARQGAKTRQQTTRSGFDSQSEAKSALEELLAEQKGGVYRTRNEWTVKDWFNQWVDTDPGLAETTRDGYRAHIRNYIIPRLGDFRLSELEDADVRDFYQSLTKTGTSSATGRGLSDRTIHRVHITLHSGLESARDAKLLYVNPADGMHSEPDDQEEMEIWTVEEMRSFLDSVADDRWYAMWRVFCMTGMRRGEVAGLKWKDIDLARRTLKVQRTRTRTRSGIVVKAPKTKRSRRSVSLDQATVDGLISWEAQVTADQIEHEARLRADGYQGDASFNPDGWVWVWDDGRPIDPSSGISRMFTRLVGRARVPRIRLHDLRHSHVSHLLLANTPLNVVSRRIGHAKEGFTLEKYSHLMPGQQEQAVDRVADLVDG